MVFFNCNNCSEALKGNKVEGHRFKCNFSTVTCVDCLKDFDATTFKTHKVCMTEDQRYGGKNYQAKPQKGLLKQQSWIEKLQDLIENSKFDKELNSYLNRILNYENIPRKKPKFMNFVKASIAKDERIAEKLWSVVEQAIKPSVEVKQNGNQSVNDNKSTNNDQATDKKCNDSTNNGDKTNDKELENREESNLKRKLGDSDQESKKLKLVESEKADKENGDADPDADRDADRDELVNKAIEKLIERSKLNDKSINPIKLTKKVLKHKENRQMKLKKFKKLIRRVHSNTEYKDLDLTSYYNEFVKKLGTKDCFVIGKEMIIYKDE